MSDIGKRLISALVENNEGKRFIPERKVDEILTPENIAQCIENSTIDSHLKTDCIDVVKVDGRKTLAILIMIQAEYLLSKFLEKYWAQKKIHLDEKLPFKLKRLIRLLNEQGQVRVVRKALKPPENKSDDIKSQFKNGDQILSLLCSLRHSNIIRLLASYTIDSGDDMLEHNFLFPLAHATLSQMLKSNDKNAWSRQFPSEYILFRQLYGLLFAIQSLYNYVFRDESLCNWLERSENQFENISELLSDILKKFAISKLCWTMRMRSIHGRYSRPYLDGYTRAPNDKQRRSRSSQAHLGNFGQQVVYQHCMSRRTEVYDARLQLNKGKIGKLEFSDSVIPTHLERGTHQFGKLEVSKKLPEGKNISVEHMVYSPIWRKEHWSQLQKRSKKLATLLSSEMPEDFLILKCVSYFHEPLDNSISMMFQFPEGAEACVMPTGFFIANGIAAFHKAGWLHKNMLAYNVIFFDGELMKTLSTRIQTRKARGRSASPAHLDTKHDPLLPMPILNSATVNGDAKMTWLGKGLLKSRKSSATLRVSATSSALNSTSSLSLRQGQPEHLGTRDFSFDRIFGLSTIESENTLEKPYLVGLNHTREDDMEAFATDGMRDSSQKIYQHPKHQINRPTQRFCPQYDCYSVGLVLLEIGFGRYGEKAPYDRIVYADVPIHHPTMWLSSRNELNAPSARGYKIEPSSSYLEFLLHARLCGTLHRLRIAGHVTAGNYLEDYLSYIGERTRVRFDEHTLVVLKSRAFYPYLSHLFLAYAIWGEIDMKGNLIDDAEKLIDLCEYVHMSLPSLKSIIFWFQITRGMLNRAIDLSDQEPWC
ncbi:hypothetical protein BDZ45DRAFT_805006 [Acephala macrosclerotiorum]|nr:hypothetical protein BDZ45DRAFT_805006 [Acephala macrosclerotiorum]